MPSKGAPPAGRVVLAVGLEDALAGEIERGVARIGYQVRRIPADGTLFPQLCSLVPAAVIASVSDRGEGILDLCRQSKKDPRTSQIPFLFLSPSRDQVLVSRAIQAGADGMLQIPASLETVLERLLRLLERRSRPSAPTEAAGSSMGTDDPRAARLAKRILTVDELPGMPFVAAKIVETIQDVRSGAADLAKVISMDQAVSAQVLRVANSAFYGQSGKVGDISKAVVLIGFSEIANLVVTVSVLDLFRDGCRTLDPVRFWEHSLGTALVAKALARETRSAPEGEAFLCGLLHDIGKVALDRLVPDEYGKVLERVRIGGGLVREAEREAFGENHSFFGGVLGGRWNLPPGIRMAVSCHHVPQSVERYDYSQVQLVRLVCLADILCKASGMGWAGDHQCEEGTRRLWSLLRLPRERVAQVVTGALADLRMIREQMGLAAPSGEVRGKRLPDAPRVIVAVEGDRPIVLTQMALLCEPYEVAVAERWTQLEAAIDAGPPPRAVVVDILEAPPDSVLLGLVRQSPKLRGIPILLVCPRRDGMPWRAPDGTAVIDRPLDADAYRCAVRKATGLAS
ncbi:MAG: HDOD domain-containing protein [Planctomycetes bacterium]|nr:HDOD domain-containing protein [Planctomycetota bacterium]